MDARALLSWLATREPAERDAALEERLGIRLPAPSSAPPGDHLVGYHASGVAPIVRALLEVPVRADDVVIDLGSGLGKVVLLTRLLTGAAASGIEIQHELVTRARAAALRLELDVRFTEGDAREADLGAGSVFFLYVPFTGPALASVLRRLAAVASRRAIVVCALGIDLDRDAPWLVRRPTDAFWLTIYDSDHPGVPARASDAPSAPLAAVEIRELATAIAFERERHSS